MTHRNTCWHTDDRSTLFLCFSFSNGQLRGPCRRRPMNAPGIISRLVEAKIVQIAAVPPSMDGLFVPRSEETTQKTVIHRLELRTYHEGVLYRVERSFREESEGKLRANSYTIQKQFPTACRGQLVGEYSTGPWGNGVKLHIRGEKLIVSDIIQSQRKTGQTRFSVLDHERSGNRGVDEEEVRQMPSDSKSSQTILCSYA